MKVRALIKRDFEEAFKRVDVIACPTLQAPPLSLERELKTP
jgi:aspartyl-tRNA(Asn)/glutamyl-tRNA(Gln) amidotransferase subunit A